MNILKLVILVLTTCFASGCIAKNRNDVEVVSITYNTGDREHHVFIGTSISKIDSSYQTDKVLKESIEDYYGADKYIVSRKAVSYIAAYINEHCNTQDQDSRNMLATYLMRIYSENGIKKCYCYDQNEAGKYFTNMIVWLEKPPFKSEYSSLIKQLKLFQK